MDIQNILNQINKNLDNPDWLRKSITVLSTALFYQNTAMSEAEVNEKKIVVKYLEINKSNGKPYTVSEAEKRGVVETQNQYGKLKAQADAIKECINSIKKRIEVLSWEREKANY